MGLLMAWAVIALAMSMSLMNFPDISMEGSMPLGAAIFAVAIKNTGSLALSVGLAMVGGSLVGATTAFIHSRFNLNKFLSAILVTSVCYSLCLRILGTSNVGLFHEVSLFSYTKSLDNLIPYFHLGTILLLALVLLVGGVILMLAVKSRMGLRVRIAGSSPSFARSLGLNSSFYLIGGLAVTNAFSALSGALLAMHQGFVDVGMSQGVLILALAGMTLGMRLMPERHISFHVYIFLSAILGSVVYQILIAYAVRLGLNPVDLKLATAVLVLVVVAMKFTRSDLSISESF